VDCSFCKALDEDEVYRSANWRIIVNLNQNRLGNVLLVLNRHTEDIIDLNQEEVLDLWAVIKVAKDAIDKSFQPSHFNYTFRMDRMRHVHLHLTPRYDEKRTFEDIVFMDNDTITHRRMPTSVHARIRGRIRRAIDE
jgi:diadenosine tetraphosphate (Ap4A) HIT family hydrolase